MSHPEKNLVYRQYGRNGPPLIILHGLFGSKENWHGIARRLSTDLRVFAIDQRNHGESPHRNRHDYRSMAEDLAVLCSHDADILGPVTGPPYPGPALFIRGGLSDYLPTGPSRRMHRHFPAATMTTISKAGHWVHSEQPEKFTEIVRKFAGEGKI